MPVTGRPKAAIQTVGDFAKLDLHSTAKKVRIETGELRSL